MEESLQNKSEHCFAKFLLYLLEFMNAVHCQDEDPSPASQIPSSQNPESGVAYYFTLHGNVVNKFPTYHIMSSAYHNIEPRLDERCTKNLARFHSGVDIYIFMVLSSPWTLFVTAFRQSKVLKGEKTPSLPYIVTWRNRQERFIYDFACSLSEYCLNCEQSFFPVSSRMWHDLFHGVTHICGTNFKSQRLQFAGFNTEIFEQFNSFIQCIKYTGTHLSQSHFTFFIQLMIYVWNQKKAAAS